ncbi:MAG: acyl carrier protein [Moorea sp. SIO4E2]|uniref:acyl carrier protein n=1 Tax=Moorena sp. SIO4E2 TaxID=2607826 RepID=UPI0013B73CD9|nr:acyl carrier protein [Moorena sp. SIO4E2]NEQ05161.1 acyl carrier protein [Moorena sp. SIO4E2]
MQSLAEIRQTTKQLVLEILPEVSSEELSLESDIFNLGLNSINAMNLLTKLQETFGIELTADDITFENFQNVAGLVKLVEKKSSKQIK